MITSDNFGEDYNHILGDYKKQFVLQYPIRETILAEYLNDIHTIKNFIHEKDIPFIKKNYKEGNYIEELNDLFYPKDIIFEDVFKMNPGFEDAIILKSTVELCPGSVRGLR